MLPIIQENQPLTMSSREIADLTGKSHSKVMRDIRNMTKELEQNPDLDFVCNDSFYLSESSGQEYPSYELDRDTTECLLTGYSIALRMKVIKRWKALEKQLEDIKPKLPDFANPVEAARAWADSQEQLIIAEKTKAQINDKRTATIMGRLGNATKTIKKLEDQLQGVGQYLSLTACKIPARVDTELKNNVQSWRLLKQLSSDMQLTPKKVKCERYGEVLAYHVDVIERFKAKYL